MKTFREYINEASENKNYAKLLKLKEGGDGLKILKFIIQRRIGPVQLNIKKYKKGYKVTNKNGIGNYYEIDDKISNITIYKFDGKNIGEKERELSVQKASDDIKSK